MGHNFVSASLAMAPSTSSTVKPRSRLPRRLRCHPGRGAGRRRKWV